MYYYYSWLWFQCHYCEIFILLLIFIFELTIYFWLPRFRWCTRLRRLCFITSLAGEVKVTSEIVLGGGWYDTGKCCKWHCSTFSSSLSHGSIELRSVQDCPKRIQHAASFIWHKVQCSNCPWNLITWEFRHWKHRITLGQVMHMFHCMLQTCTVCIVMLH